MEISVIIPTYNRTEILFESIDGLLKSFHSKAELDIIVVNDSLTNLELNGLEQIRIIQNTGRGPGNARNLGLKYARFENIAFIDDDVIFTPEAADVAIEHFLNYKKLSFCNIAWIYPDTLINSLKYTTIGRFLIHHNLHRMEGWVGITNINNGDEMPWENIASYCLLTTKSDMKSVGGYAEDIKIAGLEDYNLSSRIKKVGGKIAINFKAKVFHNEKDRLALSNRFRKKYREGMSRKSGFDMGIQEFRTSPGFIKRKVFQLTLLAAPFLLNYLRVVDYKILDHLNFNILRILDGSFIYAGYTDSHSSIKFLSE